MKILDTNRWIFGTLGTNDRAERLFEDIEEGETVSAINAYMVQEALNAFDRTPGLTARERDELKTVFLTRLTRMTGLIEAPSSRGFQNSLLVDCLNVSKAQPCLQENVIQNEETMILI